MNKNMIILIGILLLWLLVIRPLSKSSGNTQELPKNKDNAENAENETFTPYGDNVYVETSKSNNTTYENSDNLKVGGNTYTK